MVLSLCLYRRERERKREDSAHNFKASGADWIVLSVLVYYIP
jgi:hypothetical protein